MKKVKTFLLGFMIPFVFLIGFFAGTSQEGTPQQVSPIELITKPLEKYSIPALAKTDIPTGVLTIEPPLAEESSFSTHLFSFEFSPNLSKETKKTTGQINIPTGNGKHPVVLMLRGYVDQEIYKTGMGTSSAAKVFAQNGFVTVAPDFLGYGGGDSEASNVLESRFQTYVTAISLYNSINQIDSWDGKNIFIWGHSNGGQVALTLLEITGATTPTTLWAPVSKPFPYSVLYYTDESEDKGKFLRAEIANFEKLYDADLYSVDNYFGQIIAPVQLHQGTADDAVPLDWSDTLAKKLEDLDILYFKYSGADHNLRPSWNTVVQRDLSFFAKNTI